MSGKRIFEMYVEDIFEIKSQGIAVTGTIRSGSVHSGDVIEIIGDYKETVIVAAIEKERSLVDEAITGDAIGLLLRNIPIDHISIGDLLVKYSDDKDVKDELIGSTMIKDFIKKSNKVYLNITKTDFSVLVKKLISKMGFEILVSKGGGSFYAMKCIRDNKERFAIGCLLEDRNICREDLEMMYTLDDRNFIVFSYADQQDDKLKDRYGQEIGIVSGNEFVRLIGKYLRIDIR